MVLAALNLRPVISAFGPLLPQIQEDLGVSAATVSLLTSIPLVCWGLLALVAPALVRRRSAETVIVPQLKVRMVAFIRARSRSGVIALR